MGDILAKIPKSIFIWTAIILGKILIAFVVFYLSQINDNFEEMNKNMKDLGRISDRQEIRVTLLEDQIIVTKGQIKDLHEKDKEHDLEIKEINKKLK